jgi:UDP-N-acetylglucosamine/UDP-N-acetylgalactosamine diphosphorylase
MSILDFEKAKEILKKFGQEHVLLSYERLSDEMKEKLLKQVLSIDFEQIQNLYENTKKEVIEVDSIIEPIEYTDSAKIPFDEKEKYLAKGEEIIKAGKYAVITMAGGQGTRLGHNGPKGTFDMGLNSHKSLFEILCDILKDAKKKYGVDIPWYIMTSRENNNDTVKFFEDNNYFGYSKEAVRMFFMQNELPMIDQDGKVIIGEDGLIKEAADGHGGVFEAVVRNGVLTDMQQNGIEWVYTCAIDNPLVKMTDPLLIGYAAEKNVLAASKSIVKAGPTERVGVFCKRDGKPSVIEYIEITEEMANQRDENGELVYGESHIMMNLFNIKAIENISKFKLPYHSAFKKCAYMNETGEIVNPTAPNAYKFEAFIFDAFSTLPKMGILRGKREEEFAPIKNAEGVDSPETARKLYKDYWGIN